MSKLCDLTVAEHDGIALATLAGELDMSNADDLAAELQAQISNQALAVIVDLSPVDYLDSYGVGFLFELASNLRKRQQELRVVVPTDSHLKRVMELVEFGRIAAVEASVEDARASLAARFDGS